MMKHFKPLFLYGLTGILGGIGLGVILTNIWDLGYTSGIIIAIIGFILSVTYWNVRIKKLK